MGEGDLTLFNTDSKMKIVYSEEFLETFTGTQEELDDLTDQIRVAIEKGNYYPIDEEGVPHMLH